MSHHHTYVVCNQMADYTVPYPVTTDRFAKCHAGNMTIVTIVDRYSVNDIRAR